ncbi:hypothetical protein HDU84_007644 [Entophlyctis sp. JEL0112]|nr:hypothetical protein HDU84_007644 [Entophlyctis sp. JEL0112]
MVGPDAASPAPDDAFSSSSSAESIASAPSPSSPTPPALTLQQRLSDPEAALLAVLRRTTSASQADVDRIQNALDAFTVSGGNTAVLIARLTVERNALRSQLRANSKLIAGGSSFVDVTTSAANLSATGALSPAGSDVFDEDNEIDEEPDVEGDGDVIAMAATPSRAQVRRSILSVLNTNARFSLSFEPSLSSLKSDSPSVPTPPPNAASAASAIAAALGQPTPADDVPPSSPSSSSTFLNPRPPSNASIVAMSPRSNSAAARLSFASLPTIAEPAYAEQQASSPPKHPQRQMVSPTNSNGPTLVVPRRGQSNVASARLSNAIASVSATATASAVTGNVGGAAGSVAAAAADTHSPTTNDAAHTSLKEADHLADLGTDGVIMEGFLVKKMNLPFGLGNSEGSGFGWKPRYYKLRENSLEEFDTKTNSKVVVITIKPTMTVTLLHTSPQSSASGTTAHAFTITEHRTGLTPHEATNTVKHTLCTHAQADRDAWVDAINSRIRAAAERELRTAGVAIVERQGSSTGFRRDQRRRSEAHLKGDGDAAAKTGQAQQQQQQSSQQQQPMQQGTRQRNLINMVEDGSNAAIGVARKGLNMVFGSSAPKKSNSPKINDRIIFGVSLEKGVRVSKLDSSIDLSSVITRCLEFLESGDPPAIKEEGIYRVSGATTQIQALKNQFDSDGDVNLVKMRAEGELIDVHAVTSLVKLYLRELPDSLLGDGELKTKFIKCANLQEKGEKTRELSNLLPQLPSENYCLLKRISKHLRLIVEHRDSNKMNMSNLSIVFSPTLGVPGPLLQIMVMDLEDVFVI